MAASTHRRSCRARRKPVHGRYPNHPDCIGKPLSKSRSRIASLILLAACRTGILPEMKHLARERLTIAKMIGIYCSGHHDTSDGILCATCQDFMDYVDVRLRKCPYGDDKPTCTNCPVHCFKPAHKAKAKEIMRYAGPRMLLRHPWLAISHQMDAFRKVEHPRSLTRQQRLPSRKK